MVADDSTMTLNAFEYLMLGLPWLALLNLIKATEIQHRFQQTRRPDHLMAVRVDNRLHRPPLGRACFLPLGCELMVLGIVALSDHLKRRHGNTQDSSWRKDTIRFLEKRYCFLVANMLNAMLNKNVRGCA